MLVLLPPSETKVSGGTGAPLSLDRLSFPELNAARRLVVEAVVDLARDREQSIRALKLGPKSADEAVHNEVLATSPTMHALDRFTGVVFDAFDASSLTEAQRAFAAEHVVIHSALWGLVRAGDPIPAYRLSHDSRPVGLSLKKVWSAVIADVLSAHPGIVIDLRSESYAALGPLRESPRARYIRVVTRAADGRLRSLNHFNKLAKGRFARAVVDDGVEFSSVGDLLGWAASRGIDLVQSERDAELDLIVDET